MIGLEFGAADWAFLICWGLVGLEWSMVVAGWEFPDPSWLP